MSALFEPDKGVSITTAALQAITAANALKTCVELRFNGIQITVDPRSYVGDINLIYHLQHEIRRLQLSSP